MAPLTDDFEMGDSPGPDDDDDAQSRTHDSEGVVSSSDSETDEEPRVRSLKGKERAQPKVKTSKSRAVVPVVSGRKASKKRVLQDSPSRVDLPAKRARTKRRRKGSRSVPGGLDLHYHIFNEDDPLDISLIPEAKLAVGDSLLLLRPKC